jgi:hypothetical protein
LVRIFTNNGYHGNRWTATGDADTGISAGNSFHFDFTLVSANTYNLVLSPIGGGAPWFMQTGASLAGTAGVAINRLRITAYGTGSSTNGSKEMFFDNLMIGGPVGVPGDYNKNGTVDAADYVVWRNTLGLTGPNLAADGNANNEIDVGDFDVWRAHFGQTDSEGIGASSDQVVPEPAAVVLNVFGLLTILGPPDTLRRARRRKSSVAGTPCRSLGENA